MYQPIDCDLHDYIEIACMKGYTVKLELADKRELIAQAQTTQTNRDKSEELIVNDAGQQQRIQLDQIVAMTPLDHNAEFGRIVFRNS